jgi:hypothetical protein
VPVEEHDEAPYAASTAPSARTRSAPSGSQRRNVGSALLPQDSSLLRRTIAVCTLLLVTLRDAHPSTTCAMRRRSGYP